MGRGAISAHFLVTTARVQEWVETTEAGGWNRWVEIAPDFATFAAMIGLLGPTGEAAEAGREVNQPGRDEARASGDRRGSRHRVVSRPNGIDRRCRG